MKNVLLIFVYLLFGAYFLYRYHQLTEPPKEDKKYIQVLEELNACRDINQRLLTNGKKYYGTRK